jgi:hypothetical protein
VLLHHEHAVPVAEEGVLVARQHHVHAELLRDLDVLARGGDRAERREQDAEREERRAREQGLVGEAVGVEGAGGRHRDLRTAQHKEHLR